jgi:hypothetical protein
MLRKALRPTDFDAKRLDATPVDGNLVDADEQRMFSGDRCELFAVYQTACCGYEIVLIDGAVFPACPTHKTPAIWNVITAVGPPNKADVAA